MTENTERSPCQESAAEEDQCQPEDPLAQRGRVLGLAAGFGRSHDDYWNDRDLRVQAMHWANNPSDAPEKVVACAKAYLAFLKGEATSPATDRGLVT